MADYYDYVLGAIPIALAIPITLMTLTGIPLTQATPIAAVGAVGLIGHAMFINTPINTTTTKPPETQSATATYTSPTDSPR